MARKLFIVPLLGISALAAAQDAKPAYYDLFVGAPYFTSSETRDGVGNFAAGVALGYIFDKKISAKNMRWLSVEADYYEANKNGNRLAAFGLFLMARSTFDSANPTGPGPFYGAGIGLASTKVSGATGAAPASSSSSNGSGGASNAQVKLPSRAFVNGGGVQFSNTELVPVIKLLIGYKMNENFSLELQYRISRTIEGVNPNSLGLYVGYRF
jgi:hypothetical protein